MMAITIFVVHRSFGLWTHIREVYEGINFILGFTVNKFYLFYNISCVRLVWDWICFLQTGLSKTTVKQYWHLTKRSNKIPTLCIGSSHVRTCHQFIGSNRSLTDVFNIKKLPKVSIFGIGGAKVSIPLYLQEFDYTI